MPLLSTVPVEVYLRSTYEPDAEFVDGEIEQRPMGEYDHATWQQAIQRWFIPREREWNLRVRAELRVQVSPTRYRVPDVVVFERSRPIEQILTHPPIAVFEILSPEDSVSRLLMKLRDYEAMGVPTIMVVAPEQQTISRYQSGTLAELAGPMQSLPGTPAFIDWDAVRTMLLD